MGPRLFSRGRRSKPSAGPARKWASMGPRLFSRGRCSRCCCSGCSRCSLQWGRGFSAAEGAEGICYGELTRQCFNGAAAFQPRKDAQEWEIDANGVGFNGAAAFQPRKGGGQSGAGVGNKVRFNGAAAFQPRKERILRIIAAPSRCFNGAAAFQPRKARGWTTSGRPTAVRFNGAAAFQPRKGVRRAAVLVGVSASMGPRLFSRGRRGFPACHGPADLASMGPRLFSRGRIIHEVVLPPELPRRFNGAAAFQPRKSPCGTTCGSNWRGFNGAAAFQPRKLETASLSRYRRGVLQWGRGFSAAEGPAGWIAGRGGHGASMGPRLFSRGSTGSPCGSPGRTARFNGAAAFQPRKEVASTCGLLPMELQWGRGFSAAEVGRDVVGEVAEDTSFNGAAAFQPRKARPPAP